MKKTFKVEIRDDCKMCGSKLPNARFRTFCSKKCRVKFYNEQFKDRHRELQRQYRARDKAEKE